MGQEYKTLKENFVSNLAGGSVAEVNYVTTVAPAAYLLWSALQTRQDFFTTYGPASFGTDFLLNVAAILFATTLYSSNAILLNALFLSPAAILYLLPSARAIQKRHAKPPPSKNPHAGAEVQEKRNDLPIRPFITAYRGSMMIITCLAILAVDFRVFPRRFAKVENWGTSLMDMGVGSFVFSAGLVSARPVLQARLAGGVSPLSRSLYSSLKTSIPLLILGFIRLYSVKGLDYAEHVTEYGVHWNFFFTLALLPPFGALFISLTAGAFSTASLSLCVAAAYEAVLDSTDLKSYILTAPRINFLSQNREGIFSFWGYLAMFLAGQATGFGLFSNNTNKLNARDSRKRLVINIIVTAFAWISLFLFSTSYKYGLGLRVSRRLANLPYVLWVSAFNCTQISVYCLIETLCFPGIYLATDKAQEKKEVDRATSRIVKAFNRNGLAIFLLANLMTGVVNMTFDTLSTGPIGAMGVLMGYAGLLTAVAVLLDTYNVSLKL